MYRPIQRQWLGVWAFALLLVGLFHAMTAQAGYTPAGTIIKNLATVTYQDSQGNNYSAQSNESVVKVAEVYVAELEKDQVKDGAVGQTVYFPHQLYNKGNIHDQFTLSLVGANVAGVVIYHDVNGNGVPDSGESEIAQNSQIKVDAGKVVNLVVAVPVPVGASGDLTVDLKAVSSHRAFENQTQTEKTNTDTVKITDGPVLVARKQVIAHTPAELNKQGAITYRIEITNNGTDLVKGAVYDFLPNVLDLDSIQDPSGQDARLSGFNITDHEKNELPTSATVLADAHDKAMYLEINNLTAGGSVAFEFSATYKAKDDSQPANYQFEAGQQLKNKAFVTYQKPANTWEKFVETNTTITDLPQFYGVEAFDRSGQTKKDTLDQASAGGIAEFKVIVKNPGNGQDNYTLVVDKGTFPQNTVFTFWDETGSLPLVDSEAGVILKGQQKTIVVKAQLPAGKEKQGPFEADFTATSVGDSSKSDTVKLVVTRITGSSVDLAYTQKTAGEWGHDKDPFKNAVNVPNQSLAPGSTVVYDLVVHNESGAPRAFNLSAHTHVTGDDRGSYVGGTLDNGWIVRFRNNSGQLVTSTPVLADKGVFAVKVELTVPAAQSAMSGEFAVIATDGHVNDAIKYHVVVEESGKLLLTPNGANQIEPGGAVFYNHTLVNATNKRRAVQVTGINSLTGWQHVITSENQDVEITPEYMVVIMEPGDSVDFTVKVLSPANALPGSMDVLSLTAQESEMDGDLVRKVNGRPVLVVQALEAKATDSTTVIKGQIRLYKNAAILHDGGLNNCQGAVTPADFSVNPGNVEPGKDCVVWQIIARNEGDAEATQVTVRDAAPEFTTLVAGSAVVEPQGMGAVVEEDTTSGDVVFNIGHGATNAKEDGGTLKPGESVEVRFTVKVN